MTNIDYLYNPDAAKEVFDKDHFLDKKLGFQVIKHGTILPHKDVLVNGKWTWGQGGIIDSNSKFIGSSHVHNGAGSYYTPPPPESIQHSSETVIYLGLFFPVWGHCLTDNIRRLWFLKSDYFSHEFKNCPLVYIPWEKAPLESQKNFRRLLEILEVDVDRLHSITQPTKFENIILPDSSYADGKFTTEYRETIDRVKNFALKNRTPTSSKKVYYFYGRNQIGEKRLAEYFKSKGYVVIRPETLTLDEQLNILINVESFASTIGSCSMNSAFLREAVNVVLIPRAYSRYGGYQQIMDQLYALNVNYVDSSLSLFYTPHMYYCFIISEQLKRFFGDKWNGYEEDDFKTFLQYVTISMKEKGRSANPSQIKGYGKAFEDFMSQLKQREDLITACNMPPRWETFQPTLSYQTHIHTKGWIAWQSDNQISGSVKDKLDIQAVKIRFPNHEAYYAVYYNAEEGWSEEVSNGERAGTTGKTKAIYGIKIRLDEAGQKKFDILYRVHKFDGEWTAWAKNDETLYSYGQKLNALQIKLESKTAG